MKKSRLLIVDDSVNFTILYKQELEDAGYHVEIADSFTTGVELLSEKQYDFIIIDPMLKDINDYDTLQNKLKGNGKIPIIINTVSSCFKNDLPLRLFNVDVCIMKLSDLTELKTIVDVLLDYY